MTRLRSLPLGLVWLQFFLAGCEDQCSNFSTHRFNCEQIANATYNLHFTLPDHTELSLGRTSGLNSCARMASDYAKNHSVPKRYKCCMVTGTSSCAEVHH
jgi:hypothetical protein